MSGHTISITTIGRANDFYVGCSCGKALLAEDHADLTDLIDLAREHMEETFPVRLIEGMNRPARVSAKDLGLSEDEDRRLFPGVAE